MKDRPRGDLRAERWVKQGNELWDPQGPGGGRGGLGAQQPVGLPCAPGARAGGAGAGEGRTGPSGEQHQAWPEAAQQVLGTSNPGARAVRGRK